MQRSVLTAVRSVTTRGRAVSIALFSIIFAVIIVSSASVAAGGPVILYATTVDSDYNGYIDRLVVKFSEDINGTTSSVTAGSGFDLAAYTILSGLRNESATITFVIAESSTPDQEATPLISYDSAAGNVVSSSTGLEADAYPATLVKTSNYITNFQYLDTDTDYSLNTLIFTFTKTLYGAAEISDWTVTDADTITNLIEGLTDDNIYMNANQVFIFLADNSGSDSKPSYAYLPSGASDLLDSDGAPLLGFSYTSDESGGGGEVDDATIPIADAGDDLESDPAFITLDGGGSLNTDGTSSGLIYSWAQLSGPATVELDAATTSEPTFTAKKPGDYLFELTVSNTYGSVKDTVTVTINNIAPTVNAGKKIIMKAGDAINLAGAAIDMNDDELSYSWTASGNSKLQFTDTLAPLLKTKYLVGSYTFTLTASDGMTVSEPSTVDVLIITDENNIPSADAGFDVVARWGEPVKLNGIDCFDDGAIALYEWTQVSGPAVALSGADTANPEFVPLEMGVHSFTLTITDDTGIKSTPDTVNIFVNSETVGSVNHLPRAIATATPQMTNVNYAVTLKGNTSVDTDGDALTYSWTQISGPTVALSGAESYQAAFVPIVPGTYTFRLVVNDGKCDGIPSDITVYAEPIGVNTFPIAMAAINSAVDPDGDLIVNINQASNVVLEHSNSIGTNLEYYWEQVAGPTVILYAGISFFPTESKRYRFRLTVTDENGVEDTDEVEITVETYDAEFNPTGNLMPALNSGSLVFAKTGKSATFYGGNSYDPSYDGDGVTDFTNGMKFCWVQTEGPVVTLSSPYAMNPYFVTPMAGTYKFDMYVFDGVTWSLPIGAEAVITPAPPEPAPEPTPPAADRTGSVSKGCFLKSLLN